MSLFAAALASSALLVAAPDPPRPTAEDVLAGAVAAIGGQQSWDAIQTLTWRGTFSAFSRQHPFVLERKRPNLYRFEHHEADIAVTIAYDGTRAWWDYDWIPFSEVDWPTDPPLAYSQGFAADAEFVFAFLDYKTRGHRPTLIGRTDFEGADVWEIQLELGNGTTESWYFDAESFLPVARISKAGYAGFPVELRTFYADWRDLEEIRLPYRIESELGNRFALMLLSEVAINEPITDEAFHLPIAAPMKGLTILAGRWSVAVESRPTPTLPWLPSQGTSTITPLHDGQVLEENLSYVFAGKPRTVQHLFSYNRFRNQIEIVHVDNLTNHAILLRGTPASIDTEAALDATNVETDSAWGLWGATYHNRYVLHELAPDSFEVNWEVSNDGGNTWGTLARFHYTRNGTTDETEPN